MLRAHGERDRLAPRADWDECRHLLGAGSVDGMLVIAPSWRWMCASATATPGNGAPAADGDSFAEGSGGPCGDLTSHGRAAAGQQGYPE
jgi:hypothetical protein